MKERFKTHFGSSYDTFFDDGEQIMDEKTFKQKRNPENTEE